MEKLALLGGEPVISEQPPKELFKWPIITEEDEAVALDVIRNNRYSGTDITEQFQNEFAQWIGRKYAVAYCNGTASLTAAMFAVGLGEGDEIICPTKTYWASISQAINFGASAVFCNIKRENLSMDPDDLERCITKNTKAIMVVHYLSHPCDMDRIMEIAKRHNIKVIEDVSHAQGAMYKGRKVGTFGDVAAMSMMSEKAFAAGELGMVVTDDRICYERALAFGHYEKNNAKYIQECEEIKPFPNVALGGLKGRANQLCSALARVQLKYYDERTAEIRKAVNYFWDLLEGLPGIRAVRVDESDGSHMGGWYIPVGTYYPEELHGLSSEKFCEAIRAEGFKGCWAGANYCLHTSNFFKGFDIRNAGVPSRIEYNDRDVRVDDEKCDISATYKCFYAPWFKHFDKEWIELYAKAFRKVIENHEQLLESDTDTAQGGRWYGTTN